jgi:hypothetical protein
MLRAGDIYRADLESEAGKYRRDQQQPGGNNKPDWLLAKEVGYLRPDSFHRGSGEDKGFASQRHAHHVV